MTQLTYAQQIFKQFRFYNLFCYLPDDLIILIRDFLSLDNIQSIFSLLRIKIKNVLIHIKPEIYMTFNVTKLRNTNDFQYLVTNYKGKPFNLKPLLPIPVYKNQNINQNILVDRDILIDQDIFLVNNKKMTKNEYQRSKAKFKKSEKFNAKQQRKNISKLEYRLRNKKRLKKNMDRLPYYDNEWAHPRITDYNNGVCHWYNYDYDHRYPHWCEYGYQGNERKKVLDLYNRQFDEVKFYLYYFIDDCECPYNYNNPLHQYKNFHDFFVNCVMVNKQHGNTRCFRQFLNKEYYDPYYVTDFLNGKKC